MDNENAIVERVIGLLSEYNKSDLKSYYNGEESIITEIDNDISSILSREFKETEVKAIMFSLEKMIIDVIFESNEGNGVNYTQETASILADMFGDLSVQISELDIMGKETILDSNHTTEMFELSLMIEHLNEDINNFINELKEQ